MAIRSLLCFCIVALSVSVSPASIRFQIDSLLGEQIQTKLLGKDLPAHTTMYQPNREHIPNESNLPPCIKLMERIRKQGFDAPQGGPDTLIVGPTAADTLRIEGHYFHDGVIIVWGNGRLVFDSAVATIRGDLVVWGDSARVVVRNSTLNFPQEYLYQRNLIAAKSAAVDIFNSTLNYSGMSHNLVIADSAVVTWRNVVNIGFTTCGLSTKGRIDIDGANEAGEYIMTNSARADIRNAATALIWHHVPRSSSMRLSFPSGDYVDTWLFNSDLDSTEGIHYTYSISNCTNVMWGLMPEPGSLCRISNSQLRAVGLWFKDVADFYVAGLVNESHYEHFRVASDGHDLTLTNTDVRTWSVYTFENTNGLIKNSIIGEVGTFSNSNLRIDNSIIDGSGGYMFTEDRSVSISQFTQYKCDFLSSDTSWSFMIYGSVNPGRVIAKDQSLMFLIQCNLNSSPEIYDDAMVWYIKLEGDARLASGGVIPILGSAWIKKGSDLFPHLMSHYDVEYRHPDSTVWNPLCGPIYKEANSHVLCNWDTRNVLPGTYMVRLTMYDDTPDVNSIETWRAYTLIPTSDANDNLSAESVTTLLRYDPTNKLVTLSGANGQSGIVNIYETNGRLIQSTTVAYGSYASIATLSRGLFFYSITIGSIVERGRIYIF